MLDAREPTQNKALHVYLYSGRDFSQGFFNKTGSRLQCTNAEEPQLPHSQLKKNPFQASAALITAVEPGAEPSVGFIL